MWQRRMARGEPIRAEETSRELLGAETGACREPILIKASVDSGASRSAMDPRLCPHIPVEPSPASIAGVGLLPVNGRKIPNMR